MLPVQSKNAYFAECQVQGQPPKMAILLTVPQVSAWASLGGDDPDKEKECS